MPDHKSRLKPVLPAPKKSPHSGQSGALAKALTGIAGLDSITHGGLPRGRPTLVCGGAGCGKTLLALEFLLRGAAEYDEPGLFVAFEETEAELIQNAASLGFNLPKLIAQKRLLIEYIHVERGEIEETGEYDLEGLFIRLGAAMEAVGARRVALDTLEALFGGFDNAAILRDELRRLFRWLKQRGATVVVTAERGEGSFTRRGLEEYVSDCVILLDQRIVEQVSTRRIRIVKYRGSAHGTNEYPFLIDDHGISVMPITALGLEHPASNERVSSGVPALDEMLGGKGFFRGASVLVSGTAGAGKSSLAATFADAVARRGERCLYFAFEESPEQIMRNMRSIGLDLRRHVRQGGLRYRAVRPSHYGLEMHLAMMQRAIEEFQPQAVVIDPITNLTTVASESDVLGTLTRLIDYLKSNQITALFTSLTSDGAFLEHTDVGVSSLVDTWLMVRGIDMDGERNRGLSIIKSRGMAHSNQLREFRLTGHGIELEQVYAGSGGFVTGAARAAQEAQDKASRRRESQARQKKQRALEIRRQALEAQIAMLRAEFEAEATESRHWLEENSDEAPAAGSRGTRPRSGQSSGNGPPEADMTTPAARQSKQQRRGG